MSFSKLSIISKRYVARSKLVLFILGIILISVIAGFFGSFFAGIQERDYFLSSNSSNVITIMQPGVKTPSVSYVPASLEIALQQVHGILSISPEVYSLVMVSNKAVNFHGISSNFFELSNVSVVEGESLSSLFTGDKSNIFFAGKTLANALDLQIGSVYNIYSTTSESFSSFRLVGILSFDSFLDEELFSGIANVQFFRPSSANKDFSLIRLHFDDRVVTKAQVNRLLQTEFSVDIQLNSQIPVSDYTSNRKISVYSSSGKLITSGYSNTKGQTSFKLPVGVYDVIVETNIGNQYFNLTVLDNMQKDLFLKDFIVDQSDTTLEVYNLTIKSFYGDKVVSSARIQIEPPFGTTFTITNQSISSLNRIPAGYYKINAYYNDLIVEKTIFLNGNKELFLNFTYLVNFDVRTPLGDQIPDLSCSLYNFRTDSSTSYLSCPNSLYLEKSIYNISFSSPQLGSESTLYEVLETDSPQSLTLVMGNVTRKLVFKDDFDLPLSNRSVERKLKTEQNYSFYGVTDSNGEILFNTTNTADWFVRIINGNQSAYFELKHNASFTDTTIFRPFSSYEFRFQVYNGSDTFKQPLPSAKVLLTTQDNQNYELYTDSNGEVSVQFSSEQIVEATVEYFSFQRSMVISTLESKSFSMAIGNIDILLTTKSLIGIPLGNVKFTITSTNYNQSFYSSPQGELHISLPTSEYFAPEIENFLQRNIDTLDSFNNTFIYFYTYEIEVSFQNKMYSVYIPKTYFSNRYVHQIQIPYTFQAKIKLNDFVGKHLPDAVVTMTNTQYDWTFIGLTDYRGLVTFDKLDPGEYLMKIKYQGLTFRETININSSVVKSVELPIVSANVKTSYWRFNLSAIDGKQYFDQFYSTSLVFFIQIATILFIIIVIILVFLFSSSIKFVIESIIPEMAVLKILGASDKQIICNTLYQLQLKALLSSTLGITIGIGLTFLLPSFQNIQLLGFVISPKLSLSMILLSLVVINGIILFVLLQTLRNLDWDHPLALIREKNLNISRI